MASYEELFGLFRGSSELRNKVSVACTVKAAAIADDLPGSSAGEKSWAQAVFNNPTKEAEKILMYLIASNKDLTVAAISGASDAAIQTKVDAAVGLFAGD